MNRRQFLTAAAAVPVAAAIALPELARTIILPPRGGWPTGDQRLTSHTRWFLPGDPPVVQYVHTTYGLGFAITKEEGASIEFDPPTLNEQSLNELVKSLERYGARGLVLRPARVFSR